MNDISLGNRSEQPDAINAAIDAVRARELDLAIEDVAEKSISDLHRRRI